MSNKPLMLSKYGAQPRVGAKRIINSQGSTVAYIKGNTLYDTSSRLSDGDTCGYLDANKNLFDVRGVYVGTVKRGVSLNLGFAILIITLLLALLGCSLYYSSYIMSKIGLSVYNPQYPSISLTQNGADWTQLEQLDIFGGGADGREGSGNVTRAFIPGTVGKYSFVLSNDSDVAIAYNIKFTDDNLYRIPMRYRLLSGNAYIVGNESKWVTISELKCEKLLSLDNSRTLYTLEWKWAADIDDAADTAAGQASAASYTLDIQLDAQLTNLA